MTCTSRGFARAISGGDPARRPRALRVASVDRAPGPPARAASCCCGEYSGGVPVAESTGPSMSTLHRSFLALSAGLFSAVFGLGVVQSWRQSGTIPDLDPDRLVEARALLLTGETTRAIAQLRMYADIESRRPDSWLRLGQALTSVGESAQAIEALERSVQLLPAPVEAHQQLAVLYYQAGQLERARAHARIVLRVGAQLPEAVRKGLAQPGPLP